MQRKPNVGDDRKSQYARSWGFFATEQRLEKRDFLANAC